MSDPIAQAAAHLTDAAPSSTEPVAAPEIPNAVGGASDAAPSASTASVPAAMPSASAGEAPNAALPAGDASAITAGYAMNAGGDDISSPKGENSNAVGETLKVTGDEAAHFERMMSDPPAPNEALRALMGRREPKPFEQRVEERFLTIERAIARMPHAIHTALSEGSHASPEAFASRVLHHLFSAL